MIRFGLISATVSPMAFYVVSDLNLFPVFQIVWMPLASGDEVPVLTGLNMQGFILTSLSGVVSGVALTFAVRWGLSRFTTVTPMRWGFSVFGG